MLPLVSSSTTAPIRWPGVAGVKVTDSVQLAFCANADPWQLLPPRPAAKSPTVAPAVSTSTVCTVPPPACVTVTFTLCSAEVEPTGKVPKVLCARAPAAARVSAARIATEARKVRGRKPAWAAPESRVKEKFRTKNDIEGPPSIGRKDPPG